MVNYYNPDPNITSPIPEQAYEVIRQRIVEILGVELENQKVITNKSLFETNVWMERTVPFADADLTPCVVNVLFDAGNYENESPGSSDGVYTYFIEIYSKSPSTESQDGDELARVQASRLMGVVRQILMATVYKFLGMPPGSIMNRRVTGIKNYVLDRNEQDENSIAVSRLTLEVKANEDEITERGRPIQGAITTALLSCTQYGYVFSRENIYSSDLLPDPCGCEFQVILFNSDEKPLYTLTEDTGDSFVLPNVTVVDGQGVERSYAYDPDEPIVTELCPVVCADGTVNVNGVLFDTVPSGGTINVPVRYENGTPVGTIDGGVVEIPNPATCAPATAVLKDTSGDTISTTSIASGATQNITAPNGTVNVRKSDAVLISSVQVESSGSASYSVADSVVTLEDTDGNTLDTENIKATDAATLVAPDGSITVNGVAFDSVLSGGTQNVVVRQQSGSTQVGSKQGQFWRIDNSDISINGTAFTSLPAEDSLNIEVEYANGTPVGSIVSGVWTIPNVIQTLVSVFVIPTGLNPLELLVTIDADSAGTYNTASFTGSVASATYEKNGSPATLPITVVATDTLKVIPNTDNGTVKLTGTY